MNHNTLRIRTLFLLSMCLTFFAFADPKSNTVIGKAAESNLLIHDFLELPLWEPRDAYDTAHFMMVALHFAFKNNDAAMKSDFANFFQKFMNNDANLAKFKENSSLTQSHFVLFITEFLYLSQKLNFSFKERSKLLRYSTEFFQNAWLNNGWSWKVCKTEIQSKKQLDFVNWKISKIQTTPSYCKAIIDEELFNMSIARNLDILGQRSSEITEATTAFKTVFSSQVAWDQDLSHWIFQPNVLKDHSDYLWSGYSEKKPDLKPKPNDFIAPDTSHSFRMPLFLDIFFRSSKTLEEKQFYQRLKKGLSSQFHDFVLVKPSEEFNGYRTKNFMDGSNGLYRYAYTTNSANLGFGPYELSGSLLISWWIFLADKPTQSAYCNIQSQFPLTESQINLYLGPDTTRDRHPMIKGRAQFTGGLLQDITGMACHLNI
jgi:hypothetical protein